ncbi:MAG: IS110 family transposase [Mycobacterium sp.]|uniref:IS110 family transposase n=1 Tax=Mycobacterium sp. TaxID=1785 RepID=UPI003F956965
MDDTSEPWSLVRGLLVAALRASGRPVYSINPMAVARYRKRYSMSGKKSDHADAMVLANVLRTDADRHRQLPADSDLARRITVLGAGTRTSPGVAPVPATS